jgi:hypothetical protein
VSQAEQQSKHWSDQKADIVSILTVFTALLLMAVYFISTPV